MTTKMHVLNRIKKMALAVFNTYSSFPSECVLKHVFYLQELCEEILVDNSYINDESQITLGRFQLGLNTYICTGCTFGKTKFPLPKWFHGFEVGSYKPLANKDFFVCKFIRFCFNYTCTQEGQSTKEV